ncbi:MAG: HD-GYP domain-containing protein [Coriobacteriia bacterium]
MSADAAIALVASLSGARKVFSLYPPSHPEHAAALGSLVRAAQVAASSGPFTLNWHLGRMYQDSSVLPETPGMRSVAECFEAHRVESLTFLPGFGERDAMGLVEVISMRPSADLDVAAALKERGATSVLAQHLDKPDTADAGKREERREFDRALYHRLVSALKRITTQVGPGGSPTLSGTGEIVEGVLARFMEDSAAILGLATMRDTRESDLFHSVNTMIYSLMIGAGLGLDEEQLSTLGVCALVHDIGKLAFARDDDTQSERIRALHPRVGAEILVRMPDIERTALLVAYEHHLRPDGQGWPGVPKEYMPHPYSRIVAIADRYDRLTQDPPDGAGLTPDRAVVRLLHEAPLALDETLTRVFVRDMGAFPVGSLVRLSDQSVGVVYAPGADPLRPRVRLLYGPDGLSLEEKPDEDLEGSPREILEVVEPADLAETVSDHL